MEELPNPNVCVCLRSLNSFLYRPVMPSAEFSGATVLAGQRPPFPTTPDGEIFKCRLLCLRNHGIF